MTNPRAMRARRSRRRRMEVIRTHGQTRPQSPIPRNVTRNRPAIRTAVMHPMQNSRTPRRSPMTSDRHNDPLTTARHCSACSSSSARAVRTNPPTKRIRIIVRRPTTASANPVINRNPINRDPNSSTWIPLMDAARPATNRGHGMIQMKRDPGPVSPQIRTTPNPEPLTRATSRKPPVATGGVNNQVRVREHPAKDTTVRLRTIAPVPRQNRPKANRRSTPGRIQRTRPAALSSRPRRVKTRHSDRPTERKPESRVRIMIPMPIPLVHRTRAT